MTQRTLVILALLFAHAALARAEGPRQILFLVDASTSMAEKVLTPVGSMGWWQRVVWRLYSVEHRDAPAAESVAKIDIVRDGLERFVAELPRDTVVGLRVFGQRRWLACQDSERLLGFAPLDLERFRRTLARVQPAPDGDTPLNYAVREGARDFLDRPTGRNALILLTDAWPGCPGPLPAGDELRRSMGIDLVIHVVGFAGAAARATELERLARPTGGLFLTVRDGAEVELALKRAVPLTPVQAVAVALHLQPGARPAVVIALLAVALLLVVWWLVRSEG